MGTFNPSRVARLIRFAPGCLTPAFSTGMGMAPWGGTKRL